jgi:predicted O-linked N-acetylglucosamine transferase (SPINDLY family)
MAVYESLLRQQPDCAIAHSNLGTCYIARRDSGKAIECFRKAIELRPDFVDAHTNLGMLYQELGRTAEAVECFQAAITVQPKNAAAHHHLGCALAQSEDADGAIRCFLQAIANQPRYASAYYNLGCAYYKRRALADAVKCFQQAIELDPAHSLAYCNLGFIYREQRLVEQARECFENALARDPNSVAARNNLGLLLQEHGRHAEAEEHFLRALELKPDFAEAWGNLGLNYHWRGKLTPAIDCFRRAIQLDPQYAQAYNNLGNTYANQAKHAQALECYEQALGIDPRYEDAVHNALMCLHYSDQFSAEEVYEQHVRRAELFQQSGPGQGTGPGTGLETLLATGPGGCGGAERSAATPRLPEQSHQRHPDKRLRIGYVSGDFKHHSVTFFFEPILAHRDRALTEVICYSTNEYEDATKQRLKSLSDGWREVSHFGMEAFAAAVAADGIDVLVDLSGHTAGSRVFAFGLRPAPVQVTYLGYPNTTGLRAIQYRLTDQWADPPGWSDSHHTEKLVRLPHGFLCYQPPSSAPLVQEPPFESIGEVTFGCFNNPAKLSRGLLHQWGAILQALPSSRLILKGEAFGDAGTRDHLLAAMSESGLDVQRIELLSWVPEVRNHLSVYHRVDIALDTFPYNGTTTTCEALWMGVPVISQAGRGHASRVGSSLLHAVGLRELIAWSPAEYVEKAVELASQPARLRELRAACRGRMQSAPLTNGKLIAGSIDDAYRTLWRRWCAQGTASHAALPND